MGLNTGKLILGHLIPRLQPRVADHRSEERHEEVVRRAVVFFRGQEHLVPVINISSRGTMVEGSFSPRIGENVVIQFENCARIQAFVRWVREDRVGLNFGHEIVLD
jgi:hypothetical protein